ncbi:ABC transporter ATP-binding protein [Heliophilum fasciatum]|uniref:Amino acid/amide ABC transporter ATP-binding protein 1 (HAAT family) n=1 Tax=Heliophilum fasciatum TaxID=35700 RepID=A0A4R2RLF5_9FIRM|nr:ABC transporter ATP-binding protein [Heliophilum fasciatum]MCW2278353.1 branched-chain amino acid transport system ATP-binding protein [Heliophilum fasciatum]TCP63774.1 amino acid/amide ABC transporter ATP-binding protein 1 (HAAT family) [Heliophilum fasciatum]
MILLSVNHLSKSFGGLKAVSAVNMELRMGELVGLIGPNGAGKTTVFNLLTGVYQPTEGDIALRRQSIVGLKPWQINQRGIARTFQNIRLFNNLTVLENVKIAYHQHASYGIASAILRLPGFYKGEDDMSQKGIELLKIFKLEHKKDELAKNLPYGEQRRLEIARAMAAQPQLLLLDEPAAGMNPQETAELMDMIRWVRQNFDMTILLIEHDMALVMGICERIYVLDYGQIIAEGTPAEIKSNRKVIEAYLGEDISHAHGS